MTAAEHLKALHERFGAHNTTKASYHDEMHKSHMALAAIHKERHGMTRDTHEQKLASQHEHHAGLHQRHADHHRGEAEFHRSMAAECAKAAVDNLNKLVPTEVRAVMPDNPTGLRMIPRPGSPPLPNGMPLEFEKLFKVDAD